MENIFTHWESVINLTRNDIVFEYQNKQYGAYAIRKYYPERLRNAFFYSVTGMLLLVAVPMLLQKFFPVSPHVTVPPINEVIFDGVVLPPPAATEVTKTAPPVKKTVTQEGNYVATNNAVETNPNPQDPTPSSQGTETTDGTTGSSNSSNSMPSLPVAPPPSDTVRYAPVMPEFDGLDKYLNDHIVYPYRARELNVMGKVYVTFVVDKNAKVVKAIIARGIKEEGGELLEAEALRVVRSMPAWMQGRNNDHPVAVQVTLPINFVIKSN
jgi:periplasmic protein TonB